VIIRPLLPDMWLQSRPKTHTRKSDPSLNVVEFLCNFTYLQPDAICFTHTIFKAYIAIEDILKCVCIDFIDAESTLGSLQHVDVGGFADVSEVYSDSILGVEVSSVSFHVLQVVVQ
jgi:hypothetical protein